MPICCYLMYVGKHVLGCDALGLIPLIYLLVCLFHVFLWWLYLYVNLYNMVVWWHF